MQLHELHNKKRRIKRIGRGGKRGTYSGRGQKGQRARAGHRIRPAERDILSKLPKLRGVKNKPLKLKPRILNVGDLERLFKDVKTINRKVLRDMGFVKSGKDEVKILSEGNVKEAFILEGINVSVKARAKIEKAGGTIK